jgi:predicted metal-dependent peptidase
VDALVVQVRAEVLLFACDERLAPGAPWHAPAGAPIRWPAVVAGGAGTDFRPVFDALHAQGLPPDGLVWFTDGEGVYPEQAPTWPVLWVIDGRAVPPFGERVVPDAA